MAFVFTKANKERSLKINYIVLISSNSKENTIKPIVSKSQPKVNLWKTVSESQKEPKRLEKIEYNPNDFDKINEPNTYNSEYIHDKNSNFDCFDLSEISPTSRPNYYVSEFKNHSDSEYLGDSERVLNRKTIQTNSYDDVLSDCIIHFSYFSDGRDQYINLCKALGACYLEEYNQELVEYIISDGIDLELIIQAKNEGKKVLRYDWILDCVENREKMNPENYLFEAYE